MTLMAERPIWIGGCLIFGGVRINDRQTFKAAKINWTILYVSRCANNKFIIFSAILCNEMLVL